ncbi:MAG: GC-type dockerin domain-anchored protein [Phycisphaerales bacterium]
MNARNPLLWTCIFAAGTSTAHADIFTWLAGQGSWEDHAMWNGPVGQYPDSILDTATISGNLTSATLNQNLALGTLNVLNGAAVYSSGNSIFVNADTQLTGISSSLSVTPSPSIRDFDTDTLTISQGILAMYGGLAQFDEALIINNNGGVLGVGTIEMNSTTGHLVLNDGALWATDGSGPSDTFLVTRTDSSTSKLDWTSPDASIIVWDGKTMINELPYSGSLAGKILVSNYGVGTTQFESINGFVAGATSELAFSGDNVATPNRMMAPFIDSYGEVRSTGGQGIIDSPIVALRGNIELANSTNLTITAPLLTFDSIDVNDDGSANIIQLNASPQGTINFTGGASSIVMGAGSRFDLDGSGTAIVNINNASSLWLEAEHIDFGTTSPFNGTLNIDGSLHIEPVNGFNTWTNAGEINLDSGDISGRGIINDGIIRGTGSIEGYVTNNGEIIADGGTLQFGFVAEDGNTTPAIGIIRAQTGDIVMNMNSNGGLHYFTGQAFVGNGVGIREVFQSNVDFIVREQHGATGSLSLNSGFCVFHDFSLYGNLNVEGASMIRTTGLNDAHRIGFNSTGVTTMNGTLEVDGRTWVVEGAQFLGSGTIHSVSTIKGFFMQDGADLNGVSLIASGPIVLADIYDVQASVHALTMEDTSSIELSMWYSEFQDLIITDKLTVQDHATLDGDLILVNFPETDLPSGRTVTILEAASIDGEFDSIDFSGLGPNRRAFVTITGTTVEVFVTCFADLNADGQANFFDASEFMVLYQQQDPMADLNGDGQFNFFDVSAFLSAYDMGC